MGAIRMGRVEIPLVDIGGAKIPRVMIGCSTFLYGTSTNPLKTLWRRIKFYLVPLNKIGFQMRPNRQAVLEAVRTTEKPVIAVKPLAWGRIQPREALEYIFEEDVHAVAVGIASKRELIETFSAASEVLKRFSD